MNVTSRTIRVPAATVAGLVAILSLLAMPVAHAATTTTFTVASGGLAISAPASVNLGSASAPGSISAALGQVKVDDTRGALLGSYSASVSSSDFTTGGATAAETIAASSVAYTGGVVTPAGTVVCASPLANAALSATPQAAMNATGATGTNSCTWNPAMTVTLPAAAVAGTYTGTITHSVA